MSSGPVQPSQQSFVVQADRSGINRTHGGIVAMHAVLTLALVALTLFIANLVTEADVSSLSIAPFLIVLMGQTFQLSLHCYLWGARAAVRIPLEMDAATLTLQSSFGLVQLPWEAIASITVRARPFGRLVVIMPLPGVTPQSPGVHADVSTRNWKGMLQYGFGGELPRDPPRPRSGVAGCCVPVPRPGPRRLTLRG